MDLRSRENSRVRPLPCCCGRDELQKETIKLNGYLGPELADGRVALQHTRLGIGIELVSKHIQLLNERDERGLGGLTNLLVLAAGIVHAGVVAHGANNSELLDGLADVERLSVQSAELG